MGSGWALKDLTGQTFGRLLVLYRDNFKKTKQAAWVCRCSCGKIGSFSGTNLRLQRTKSCGCFQSEVTAKLGCERCQGNPARNQILLRYKAAAKRRGLQYGIDDVLFDSLMSGNCRYCGIPPSMKKFSKGGDRSFTYNGIDRINNTIGYIPENVVSCCKICNRAKSSMSYDDFILWVMRVAHNLKGKK